MKCFDCVVIGGGAAGLMASLTASNKGLSVLLLERNSRLGNKIYLTGNGRCNYTNSDLSLDKYFSDDLKLVNKVLNCFSHKDTIAFFESIGVVPLCLHDTYYYPYSMQASSIVKALEDAVRISGVTVICNSFVKSVAKECDDKYLLETEDSIFQAKTVIICCGGNAVPKSGSDGNGYRLAHKLGHRREDIVPSLVPLFTEEDTSILHGVRLKAKATLFYGEEEIDFNSGELQFTKEGISGIPVFQLSQRAIRGLNAHKDIYICIDLIESMSNQRLEEFIRERISFVKNAKDTYSLSLLLNGFLSEKVINYLSLKNTALKNNVKDLTNDDIENVVCLLKNLKFKISGYKDFKDAQVTSGGIYLDEINDDLSSKYAKGVYFAGEILNVDGLCGGYNLQWAWSSGFYAGVSAAKEVLG